MSSGESDASDAEFLDPLAADRSPACEHCGLEKLEGHVCKGFSTKTSWVPFKRHRVAVEAAAKIAAWGQPVASRDGTRTMREAWVVLDGEAWHLGLEERPDPVDDGKTLAFRGSAECEQRGVKVRMPPRLVDEARVRACPEAKGRSE